MGNSGNLAAVMVVCEKLYFEAYTNNRNLHIKKILYKSVYIEEIRVM